MQAPTGIHRSLESALLLQVLAFRLGYLSSIAEQAAQIFQVGAR